MSGELFPIVAGIALGLFLALVRPGLPRWAGAALAVAIGVVATVISGEFEIGWEFLLIDIPLVAGSAVAAALLARLVRRRTAGT